MKWPTLEDRLKHPLKTEEAALRQLQEQGIELSEYGKKQLEKYERPTLNPTNSQEVSTPLD
jgi:hypothetical protein